jgi:hypothetical protein
MKTKDKIVEVHWLDAMADTSDYDTVDEIKKKKPYYCLRKTLGYFISQDDEYIVLCSDITVQFQGKSGYSSLLAIPKGMIKKKRNLT